MSDTEMGQAKRKPPGTSGPRAPAPEGQDQGLTANETIMPSSASTDEERESCRLPRRSFLIAGVALILAADGIQLLRPLRAATPSGDRCRSSTLTNVCDGAYGVPNNCTQWDNGYNTCVGNNHSNTCLGSPGGGGANVCHGGATGGVNRCGASGNPTGSNVCESRTGVANECQGGTPTAPSNVCAAIPGQGSTNVCNPPAAHVCRPSTADVTV